MFATHTICIFDWAIQRVGLFSSGKGGIAIPIVSTCAIAIYVSSICAVAQSLYQTQYDPTLMTVQFNKF